MATEKPTLPAPEEQVSPAAEDAQANPAVTARVPEPEMPAAGSATVLREDGPAILPVEEEREEIDMGKITITEKQEAIIRRLNDPLYTVEFLKEWVNRNDNVFINAPAALQAMGASGFFAAVRAIERVKESDGENT